MSDPRLFLRPTRPTGVPTFIAPHEAYNICCDESILLIDICQAAGPWLPGSGSIGVLPGCKDAPLLVAVEAARSFVLSEYTPDRPKSALLLHDSIDRATEAAQLLLDQHCTRVACVDRAALHASHPFLFEPGLGTAAYPNEIIPGKLYLGSAASANEAALDKLAITHVVSVVERNLQPPFGREHLLCQIPDSDDADLAPVLRETAPFIEAALRGGGRVLVHCERGASRSVSVVCAHLMRAGAPSGGASAGGSGVSGGGGGGAGGCSGAAAAGVTLADALDAVKLQRPCAQPNCGFLRQLEQMNWAEL